MLAVKNEDYNFFLPLLSDDEQSVITSVAKPQNGDVLIQDEDVAIDLYDWLNDLVVTNGFDEEYELNDTGKRLEKISDYVFSAIEE